MAPPVLFRSRSGEARLSLAHIPHNEKPPSSQGRELRRLPRYHPDAQTIRALDRARPLRLMPAPYVTVDEAGFLTDTTCAFGSQLRRDFRPEGSSRLPPSRDRCQPYSGLLVSIDALAHSIGTILPQAGSAVNGPAH